MRDWDERRICLNDSQVFLSHDFRVKEGVKQDADGGAEYCERITLFFSLLIVFRVTDKSDLKPVHRNKNSAVSFFLVSLPSVSFFSDSPIESNWLFMQLQEVW